MPTIITIILLSVGGLILLAAYKIGKAVASDHH